VEANLEHLNRLFKLPYVPELISRKLAGVEKSSLEDADMAFHEREYVRLRGELEEASLHSKLPELPAGKEALHDLLIRVRMHSASVSAS
jgi:predicted nucleotidyltransferase